MAKETTEKKLYDLLVTRDYDNFQALDSRTGKVPVNPQTGAQDVSMADMFTFDWSSSRGKNYGTAVILLTPEHELELYFGDNLGKTMEDPEDKNEWFEFMEQLRHFATRTNFNGFRPLNINQLRHSLQGQAAIKEGLFESWQGRRNMSWSAGPTEARLMIKHKRNLDETDARHLYIESLFIETAEGERYKLPFTKLAGGRAVLEHVRQGGRPYDIRGQHIVDIVEELNVLGRFERSVARETILEGDTAQLVSEAAVYRKTLKENLKRLSTGRGYAEYFESWNPVELSEQDVVIESLKHMFVKQTLDARIEQALPLLARIQQQGNAMKEANIFEAWANRLVEGTWSTPDTPEAQQKLLEFMSREQPVGADATDATEQLYDLLGDDELFDQLAELAESDPNSDCRQLVLDRMQQLSDNPDVRAVLEQLNIDADATMNPPESLPADLDDQEQEVAEADGPGAKWRQGYSASGHPPGYKHKSGEVGPLGGTYTDEPGRWPGDIDRVPVQKYRDEPDTLAGRKSIKQLSINTAGKPYKNPKTGVEKFKDQIKFGMKRHHGPVGVLPEGFMDFVGLGKSNPDSPFSNAKDIASGQEKEYPNIINKIAQGGGLGQQRTNGFVQTAERVLQHMYRDKGTELTKQNYAQLVTDRIKADVAKAMGQTGVAEQDIMAEDSLQSILRSAGVKESKMSEIDIGRQDCKSMTDAEFKRAYKMTKKEWRAKYADIVKENVLRDSTGSTFDHILDTFKRDVRDFEESGNLSDALYDALYDYYHHDMPYGVQKARTGDPYEWVSDRFGSDLGISGYGGGSPGLGNEDYGLERESAGDYAPERATHSVDGGMNNSILYDDSACNMSEAGEHCPTHGVQECWGAMANEDDEKNSSVMPALAGAAAGGAAGYALGSGALNSVGSSAPISPPVMVEKDMDRMKKLAGVKTTDEGVLGTLGGAALGSTLGAWGAGAGAVLGDKLTDEGIMAPIVGGLGGAALGGEIGKNIGSQFGSDVGTAIGKAAGQEQAGTLGSIVGGLKGGSAGSSAGGQAGAKIGQAVGGVAGLAGGAALDSASNKSKTNETELGTGIGAGIGGALGGLGGAALGGIAGHYYSEKNKGAKETDEGWKGQLAGGTVGSLAGGALGAATPIPGGALIGAALGGTGGQMLGDKLGGQETDEGVRGAIAGGALGGVATKSLKGVTAGAKLGSAIQDRLSKKDDTSPLAGQYGHSGKMQAVDKDTSFLDRLKELSGMKQS